MTLPPLVDSHCHLTHQRFAGEVDAVVARANAAGIARMVTIGTGIADGRRAREIARAHPEAVACTVGLDPFACHEAGDAFAERLRELDALLAEGGFSALGEVGLEHHHPLNPHALQIEQLEAELALARARDLPVVIHVRDAHPDMIACLARNRDSRGVIHSFDGDDSHVRAYLDLGWRIALNGMVTFKPKDYLRRAAALVPNDRLLVETDSPYLAPVPLRGQRCEPAFVAHTLAAVAELRGQRVEDLARWTTRNACELFGLAAPLETDPKRD
jgi:TatD DNase family protein